MSATRPTASSAPSGSRDRNACNALNHRALIELHDAVRRVAEDNLRCLVLTGDEGHFCAGADLTELEDLAFTGDLRAALDDLSALPLPTVAAIAGSCMGLGMQLALACDLRLATADARSRSRWRSSG
ncbi:MAG: enoyl-CoA hydratase/isomerase family protein [Microthrixaceae bacterium]|nr:enoyl-CoA hydratase/isomerase family protein [Microthrixaceae bacterium]